MSQKKHTHKWQLYQRRRGRRLETVKIKEEKAYICSFPDCGSFKPLSQVLNKFSICNKCGRSYIFDLYASKRSVPVCTLCRNTLEGALARQTDAIIDEMLIEKAIEQEIKEESIQEVIVPDWLKLDNEALSELTFDDESIKGLNIEPEDMK